MGGVGMLGKMVDLRSPLRSEGGDENLVLILGVEGYYNEK
jgi:hypothetical protein